MMPMNKKVSSVGPAWTRRGNKQKLLEKIATEGNLTESLSLRCIFLEKQKLPQSFLTEV